MSITEEDTEFYIDTKTNVVCQLFSEYGIDKAALKLTVMEARASP